MAESFTRGMRVIVAGRLQQRSYETKDGDKRSVYELQVDEAGPSLRNATAKVTKASRGHASTGDTEPWAGEAPSGEPPF